MDFWLKSLYSEHVGLEVKKMAKNIHQLNHAVHEIERRMDEKAQRDGERLANNIIDSTRNGGGLWWIIKGPFYIVFFIMALAYLAG